MDRQIPPFRDRLGDAGGAVEERLGYLAGTLESVRRDVAEIKADVRALLTAQWRRDGRAGVVAAIVSVGVTLGALLFR